MPAHELGEVEVELAGIESDSGDHPVGADRLPGFGKCGSGSGGFDQCIRPVRKMFSDLFGEAAFVRADDEGFESDPAGGLKAGGFIPFGSGDQHLGSAAAGGKSAKHPDDPGATDHHPVTRTHGTAVADAVLGHGERFGEGGKGGIEPVGDGDEKFGVDANILGHASVEVKALNPSAGGELGKAIHAVTVVGVMGSLQGDHHGPVAFLPVSGIGPGRDHGTG